MATDVESFREYVTARLPALRRVAYLLSGDWHQADDVLSATPPTSTCTTPRAGYGVRAWRADGTHVLVDVDNFSGERITRPAVGVERPALRELAVRPELTLFP
ncbi:hypothetical protein KZZ52_23150 [Dactylosporangium sp. AC04546]|uniref:hypothetical protein n=1 Tax=Dactylosporangium sp. AC04546 TaxID=2862460 RepID=UPI0027DF5E2D|nr:hypothetical protein [Dactylosporangium sp. AC04546]WVK88175.1 hypothetical protein KZZ52_23150 [Dactylosporangium sp. AC04546]